MEDFVTYQLAVKLNVKGFDEECLACYTSEHTLYTNKVVLSDDKYLEVAEIDYEECLRSYNTQKDRLLRTIIDAPTISQVLKWLRKEKDIHIEIFLYNGKYSYFIKSITKISEDDYFHQCLNEDIADMEYETHELAALAGIEYVLDNLI